LRLAVLALLAATPLQAAEPVRDPGTGLALQPPDGFTAQRVDPLSGDAQINIAWRGSPACRQLFAARSGARPDAAQLRATVDTAAWREELGARLSRSQGSTTEGAMTVARFEQGTAIGGTAHREGPPAFAIFVLETPAGRTTLFCQSQESPAPLARWRALAESVQPPS
jgi:hypothetical protein